ncbi:hypothetical protein [Algibacillus agarilyticus]|uniref:hypothetical protein n=1 Tax=Algibacillus agarilyticus TaxID=2234133 RepID=UPI000DCFD454|nr:hypothetical protein [Algibacillus agarilyticus]
MKSTYLSAAMISISLLSACSSTTEPTNTTLNTNTSATNAVDAKFLYLNEAKEAIDKFETVMKNPEHDDLSYFAPKLLKIAKNKFADAKEEYSDATKSSSSLLNIFSSEEEQALEAKNNVLQLLLEAENLLDKASTIKTTAKTILGDVFTRREYLKQLNVTSIYPKTFKKIEQQIDNMVEDIADGDVAEATQQQAKVSASLFDLEVKTVKHIELGALNKQITVIGKKELHESLPRTYQSLIAARNAADATITVDPRDIEAIKVAVDKVKFEVSHINHLAKEYSRLKNTKKASFELYILNVENNLNSISSALMMSDLRDRPISEQVDAIKTQSQIILNDLETLKLSAENSQENTDALKAKLLKENTSLKTSITDLETQKASLTTQTQQAKASITLLQSQVQTLNSEVIKLKALNDVLMPLAQANKIKAAVPVAQPIQVAPVAQPVQAVPVAQPVQAVPVIQPVKTVPVAQPVQAAPVAQPVQAVPVAQPVQAAPVAQPVQAAPVAQPVQAAPVAQPVQAAPVAQPVQTAPVAQPVQAAPVAQPVQAAPVAQPVQTAPVTQPVQTAPVAQ